MPNDQALEKAARHIDDLLNIPRQVWLLGAGISKEAGIPLMYPLTDRVEALLKGNDPCFGSNAPTARSCAIYTQLKSQLPDETHVEHILSQLGDLISLAERRRDSKVTIDGSTLSATELRDAHRHIQLAIRHTVEYGYLTAENGSSEKVGTADCPIIDRSHHATFVESLFVHRRAGLEQNPPVRFVTTNYDTLLEDALALAHVGCVDGFSGGATGFWDPRNSDARLKHASGLTHHTATICKLHGSIDWVSDSRGVVMRVRSSAINADDPTQQLLIYPQATKYQVTQRDPFASLFLEFRTALFSQNPTVLIVCGYSFGDDHINEEIERALRSGPTTLTVLALCRQATNGDGSLQADEGIPGALAAWLSDAQFRERVIVAGSHGYYRGSITSSIPKNRNYDWWTFGGICKLLKLGTEAIR